MPPTNAGDGEGLSGEVVQFSSAAFEARSRIFHSRPLDGGILSGRCGRRTSRLRASRDELIKLYRSIEGRDVASFIIHRLHDIDGEGSYWNQTGVVDQNLDPKPAYNKLRSAIGGSLGPTTVAC